MLTVGVDLAAKPKNTALATVEWSIDGAHVIDLQVDVGDDAIVRSARTAAKIGIDCPLGWPDRFVQFLGEFHDGSYAAIPEPAGQDWRRSLAYRITDEKVRADLARFTVIPLSVAADRIGITAMRAARIQSLLAKDGHKVDRAGSGLIVEVYPAGGLAFWEMSHRRYKGTKNEEALGDLVDQLPKWLHLDEKAELCRKSDHAFDAVIAALLARAAALDLATRPSAAEQDTAAREGWIAMPTCPVDTLACDSSRTTTRATSPGRQHIRAFS